MLCKKKRQSEREANATTKKEHIQKRVNKSDTNGGKSKDDAIPLEKGGLNRGQVEVGESSSRRIYLNCDPNCHDLQVDNVVKLRHLWEHINMNRNWWSKNC
jgi:hypothetical protein